MDAALTRRNAREIISMGGVVVALAVGACGGGDDSGTASVGDCIDAGKQVVGCSSSSATQKLVTDQSDPDAIACVQIGSNPQTEVNVGDGTFCAEKVK
jgi:hypothetical protein